MKLLRRLALMALFALPACAQGPNSMKFQNGLNVWNGITLNSGTFNGNAAGASNVVALGLNMVAPNQTRINFNLTSIPFAGHIDFNPSSVNFNTLNVQANTFNGDASGLFNYPLESWSTPGLLPATQGHTNVFLHVSAQGLLEFLNYNPGAPTFDLVGAGVNTTVLQVGNGGSLTYTGSGDIHAKEADSMFAAGIIGGGVGGQIALNALFTNVPFNGAFPLVTGNSLKASRDGSSLTNLTGANVVGSVAQANLASQAFVASNPAQGILGIDGFNNFTVTFLPGFVDQYLRLPLQMCSTNDASTLTNLNASKLASGTVPNPALASGYFLTNLNLIGTITLGTNVMTGKTTIFGDASYIYTNGSTTFSDVFTNGFHTYYNGTNIFLVSDRNTNSLVFVPIAGLISSNANGSFNSIGGNSTNTGTMKSGFFVGDGSQLTGVPGTGSGTVTNGPIGYTDQYRTNTFSVLSSIQGVQIASGAGAIQLIPGAAAGSGVTLGTATNKVYSISGSTDLTLQVNGTNILSGTNTGNGLAIHAYYPLDTPSHKFTTNTITTGNGTATIDFSKSDHAYLATNAPITLLVTGLDPNRAEGYVLTVSNSAASGTIAITPTFILMTNGYPASAVLLTNLDAKHQVGIFSIYAASPGQTNGVFANFFMP